MGRLLVTWDDRNNYSTHLKAVICPLLTTLESSRKSLCFTLGNLRSDLLKAVAEFRI